MLWLIAPGSARAIEWDMFADLAPALRACLDQQLGTEALSQLIALGGQRPENKALRKNASRAFKSCRESAGEVQPPGAPPPTEKACGALPAPYAGSLFDAMTQIDEREDMAAMVERVRAAGIERMALFARSRKSLGHNEDKVLALRARWPDFLVLGAPKYFLLDGDLDDDYIDATLSGVQEHRYAFIGEVLYTHGDKSHGETTARGERQVDPAAPGTAKLLAGLARLGRPVPFMTHWEVYAWDRDWARFSTLYASAPQQTFIVPHMAFGSVEQMRQLMRASSNVVLTTSKKEHDKGGYSDAEKAASLGDGFLDACGRLKAKWRDFMVEYADRVMFATDAHKTHRWNTYAELVATARRWLGQLPPDAASSIAWRNAHKLYLRRDP